MYTCIDVYVYVWILEHRGVQGQRKKASDPVCMYVCMYVYVCIHALMYMYMYGFWSTGVFKAREGRPVTLYVCMYV
jgi:hypothetical protein